MAQETTKAVVDQATDISAGSTVPRISLSTRVSRPPTRMPITPPSSAQRDRFERELKHDVLSGRAQRLTDAYLPRSFGNAHQHDVHHADAADHQTYARDPDQKDEQAAGELIPQDQQGVGAEDGEIVRLVGTHLTPAAKQLADFVFDGDFVFDIVVLDADPVIEDLRMNLVKG